MLAHHLSGVRSGSTCLAAFHQFVLILASTFFPVPRGSLCAPPTAHPILGTLHTLFHTPHTYNTIICSSLPCTPCTLHFTSTPHAIVSFTSFVFLVPQTYSSNPILHLLYPRLLPTTSRPHPAITSVPSPSPSKRENSR